MEWGDPIYFSHGTAAARGVAIPIKRTSNVQVWKDQEGRIIILDITYGRNKLKIVNVYCPNKNSPAFFL